MSGGNNKIEFKVVHAKDSSTMVEVWHHGSVIASIYPADPELGLGIKVISKFLDGKIVDEHKARNGLLPPELHVLFDLT